MSADDVIGIAHQAGFPPRYIEHLQPLRAALIEQVRILVKRNGKTYLRVPRRVYKQLSKVEFQ